MPDNPAAGRIHDAPHNVDVLLRGIEQMHFHGRLPGTRFRQPHLGDGCITQGRRGFHVHLVEPGRQQLDIDGGRKDMAQGLFPGMQQRGITGKHEGGYLGIPGQQGGTGAIVIDHRRHARRHLLRRDIDLAIHRTADGDRHQLENEQGQQCQQHHRPQQDTVAHLHQAGGLRISDRLRHILPAGLSGMRPAASGKTG